MSDRLHRACFWPASRRPGRAPAGRRRGSLTVARTLLVAMVLAGIVGRAPAGAARTATPSFRYDAAPPVVTTVATRTTADAVERDVHVTAPDGEFAATLVQPVDTGRHAGIVFVHWLGDPPTTNRSEFLPDARELARHGTTSLLIDAMWAEPNWFDTRLPSGDYTASVMQVINLRRALDVLCAQPDVDPARIAYVGHDFGAMYGALLAGVDPRPAAYVFMTPTVTLWEWYLLGVRPADTYAYIAQMRPLDPVAWLPRATMRATLLQFARRDAYVTPGAAAAFTAAVPDRDRTVTYYDADHGLAIAAAHADRLQWLEQRLQLHAAR